MTGVGVTFEDWVQKKVEKPLGYGDSRSTRVNNLCRVGIAAEETARATGEWPEDVEDQEDLVREAIAQYLQEHEE